MDKFVYRKEGLKLTKPDEIVVEQREDIHELREELWLYKKALMMACENLFEEFGCSKYYNKTCEKGDLENVCYQCLKEEYLQRAKETMKSE